MNMFTAIELSKEGKPKHPIAMSLQFISPNKKVEEPKLKKHFVTLYGEEVDYTELDDGELNILLKAKGVKKITAKTFTQETYLKAAQAMYEITDMCTPTIMYVPEDFDSSILRGASITVIRRKELKENQFVLIYNGRSLFPAYRNQEGNLEVLNPQLIVVINSNSKE